MVATPFPDRKAHRDLAWEGARWMDPTVGRWLSEDPSGLTVDANPFRYVGNAPTMGIDPSGLAEAGTTRKLTHAEKDFIVNVVKAIFLPSLKSLKASGNADLNRRYDDHVRDIEKALDNVTLHCGSGVSVVAKVTLSDKKVGAITLEGRHIYFQIESYPGETIPQSLNKKDGQQSLALLVHESIHIIQQTNDPTGYHFYAAYALEAATNGYEGISSEVEAYSVQLAVTELLKKNPDAFGHRDFSEADSEFIKTEFQRQKKLWMDKIESKK